MEVDILQMASKAAFIVMEPERLGFIGVGVICGLILGVIPGLGGLVGLSLLLPFTFTMDSYSALALLMGLSAVTVTSDTIPAVLFGVPGTVGSAATILDGHPMAKNGEAGRAFGAAFAASIFGGLFGAFLLAISVPILRPVMLLIGTPELLAICVFGISLVAILSGGTPMRGLAAAVIGLMIATVGEDSQEGVARWTFDTIYLWDGLPIVPFALGLFALPELADMAISRAKIAGDTIKGADRWSQLIGVKDVVKNWFLVLRCASIGAVMGAVPGIGASVIDWIAYGHAARTEKGADKTFGKGDVRGVIASESANNAKEGGALVPTIAFGVPGSASMALLLGAFLIHGIIPGPKMLTDNLDVTYTLVWSVAIANILGGGICFLFANQLAKLALIRSGILVPLVLALTFVGAFQGSKAWGDLIVLLSFGLLGWYMKRVNWPRPPLILGFVLGGLIENYMFISVNRYEFEWLTRPAVMVIFAFTLYGILSPIIRGYIKRRREAGRRSGLVFKRQPINGNIVFSAGVITMLVLSLFISSEWDFGARLIPGIIAGTGLIFTLPIFLYALFVEPRRVEQMAHTEDDSHAESDEFEGLSRKIYYERAALYFGWCAFYLVAVSIVGLLPALFLFTVGYIHFSSKESWKMALQVSVPLWVFCYGLFHWILIVPWPQSLVGYLFPSIRYIRALNLF